MLQAYRDAAALHTAIELELFTRIAHGGATVGGIAVELSIPVRGLRVLCAYLAAIGLLSNEGDELRLADDAATFLDKSSPAYLGDSAGLLYSAPLLHSFEHLTEALRAGVATTKETGAPPWFDLTRGLTELSTATQAFADAVSFPVGQPLKILDVCAGDGAYGIALAAKYRDAIVVALNSPQALKVAQEGASRAKLGTRYQNIPGDALLAPLGFEYDAAMMAGALHRFDAAQIKSLMMRVHSALKKAGQIVVLECLWEEGSEFNEVHSELAGLRLNMLAATGKGDAYSLAEVREMLTGAGFKSIEHRRLPAALATLVIARP